VYIAQKHMLVEHTRNFKLRPSHVELSDTTRPDPDKPKSVVPCLKFDV
jgi:hypothetical protein